MKDLTNRMPAEMRELFIQGEIMMNGTLPEMCPGATHNYKDDVMDAIMEEYCKQRDATFVNDLIEEGEALFDELDIKGETKLDLEESEIELIYHLQNRSVDPKERQRLLDEVLARY
eukprot:CAMPEP_0178741704 /NCGR_PEP_ID=MMETSP0744-20121128/5287_1 /TAXON_ID=913974 /ORGANISM="Nitzschia punctata, Strain CCMP561" /LENGTH=115 /DNA_ID=CAMNT_0020394605 /DNA_START=303 /DNA_END=650 /DNA_ORIENTATION=-